MTQNKNVGVPRIGRRELSTAIDKAVGIAVSRHRLEFQPNHFGRDQFQLPPWIVGRLVRGKIDLDQAFKSAETIVEAAGFGDQNLQAVAIKVDKDILVGFIERFGDQLDVGDLIGGGANY